MTDGEGARSPGTWLWPWRSRAAVCAVGAGHRRAPLRGRPSTPACPRPGVPSAPRGPRAASPPRTVPSAQPSAPSGLRLSGPEQQVGRAASRTWAPPDRSSASRCHFLLGLEYRPPPHCPPLPRLHLEGASCILSTEPQSLPQCQTLKETSEITQPRPRLTSVEGPQTAVERVREPTEQRGF